MTELQPRPAKRLCHVAATTEGATWMLEQLRDLRDTHDWDVTAIISGGGGALKSRLEAEGIRTLTFDFEFPSLARLDRLLATVLSLKMLFEHEKFDVVQSHLFNSMVLTRLAGWLADVPVRLAMIAGPYHLEAPTPRWIDSSTVWMETGVIGSCEYTCGLYQKLGVPDQKRHLVYYGADPAKFALDTVDPAQLRLEFGWAPATPVVGMVAYFYPKLPASCWTPPQLHDAANKRHEDLIRAMPDVLRVVPDAKLLLVGSGWGEAGIAQRESMTSLTRELGLTSSIVFAGHRSDVARILRSIDVSVQASLSENLGGTIESLLMECPLVATKTGGMVDSVVDGETGLLVPERDPPALAGAIVKLLRDRETARKLGRAGREFMLSRFTLMHTVADLDALYREELSRIKLGGGYRRYVSLARHVAAVPVFGYLGGRLAWDLIRTSGVRGLVNRFAVKANA
jgi:glycosyltransferase involved in cell wall biosynthesis